MMPPLLHDATDAELDAAISENLYSLFRALVALPGSALIEGPDLSLHLTFPANPLFKGVWRARFSPETADQRIAETIEWFRARAAPFFFWWTDAAATPPDLGMRLMAHGLMPVQAALERFAPDAAPITDSVPGLVADLNALNEEALHEAPAGFSLAEVRDEAALHDFEQVLVAGYGVAPSVAAAWVEATGEFGLGKTPWRFYLARLAGKPVAANILFTGGGVASIYGLTTVPAARRQGIGSATLVGPLLEARAAGYRYAALLSAEENLAAYERLGFRRIASRLYRYLCLIAR